MKLDEKADARLAHIERRISDAGGFDDDRYAGIADKINASIFSPGDDVFDQDGRFSLLTSRAQAKGMSAWFTHHDLAACKNWFYAMGKLELIALNPPFSVPHQSVNTTTFGFLSAPFIVVSDHPALIEWVMHLDTRSSALSKKWGKNIRETGYLAQQIYHALRGDWQELGARAEHILANPPVSGHGTKFVVDHEFYLALAKGDADGMKRVIDLLVTPKMIKSHQGIESGYTQDLISTPAMLYAKLAWRNGYEINIDSHFVPKEWLPIIPLEKYDDPFDFMMSYNPKN